MISIFQVQRMCVCGIDYGMTLYEHILVLSLLVITLMVLLHVCIYSFESSEIG